MHINRYILYNVDKKIFMNNTMDRRTMSSQDFGSNIFGKALLKCLTCDKLITPIISVSM